jgi:uncharacterized membrane protein YphA (DoxX/SURF4 family)
MPGVRRRTVAEAVGVLSLGIELLVGAFLLVAGIVKVRAGESAVIAAVGRYEIGTVDGQRLFARSLPWIEIGLGAGLILGHARDLTALGAGALLAAFEMAMARSLSSGRRHPCGCGADRRSPLISWPLVSRNAAVVAALTAAELARDPWSPVNFALAAVCVASTLWSATRHVRSRVGLTPALSALQRPAEFEGG